jgi:hypothetical protein
MISMGSILWAKSLLTTKNKAYPQQDYITTCVFTERPRSPDYSWRSEDGYRAYLKDPIDIHIYRTWKNYMSML